MRLADVEDFLPSMDRLLAVVIRDCAITPHQNGSVLNQPDNTCHCPSPIASFYKKIYLIGRLHCRNSTILPSDGMAALCVTIIPPREDPHPQIQGTTLKLPSLQRFMLLATRHDLSRNMPIWKYRWSCMACCFSPISDIVGHTSPIHLQELSLLIKQFLLPSCYI